MTEKKLSSDALDWAYNEFIKDDPESLALFEEYGVKGDVAQQVYDIRTHAGLTQAQLAELVGISESVVHDIEEAEYEGDALAMLARIASGLDKRIEIRFVPAAAGESAHVTG